MQQLYLRCNHRAPHPVGEVSCADAVQDGEMIRAEEDHHVVHCIIVAELTWRGHGARRQPARRGLPSKVPERQLGVRTLFRMHLDSSDPGIHAQSSGRIWTDDRRRVPLSLDGDGLGLVRF